ncbi:decarboxylase [Roseiarcaceae bacterium H3SJ34-1]|uniref:decarboxylase n=1 Tax=Terripilifer ovatus TaxID=3032367 RepID=UPI003AB94922|nr:decarboxylase [Roseiarcaceae bacterium H3SJ34-1]
MVRDLAADVLHGTSIIDAMKAADVSHILAVPDLHTSSGLLARIADDRTLQLIRVCKEDETIGISAGLSYGSIRSICLFQYTGFLFAMNAIRAVAVEQSMPICMMIGLLGKEPGVAPTESARFGVRIVEPILDQLGIEHHLIENETDVGAIPPAIETAYGKHRPMALLIGRRPV